MRYIIRFSQLASQDLTEILGWYQNQGITGLDKRFIEAISKTLKVWKKIQVLTLLFIKVQGKHL